MDDSTKKETARELAFLVKGAKLVMLFIGDQKAGLGADMQEIIVEALEKYGQLDS